MRKITEFLSTKSTMALMGYLSFPALILMVFSLATKVSYSHGSIADDFFVGLVLFFIGLPALVIVVRKEWPGWPFSHKGLVAIVGGLIWLLPMWALSMIAFWHVILGLLQK